MLGEFGRCYRKRGREPVTEELAKALGNGVPSVLAKELVSDFLTIRQDVASSTLGRSAPGKFVETAVQVLQYLDSGEYDEKPDVDGFLRSIQTRASSLDDGLRICTARVARSMYALRSKRSIAHKGAVDPNRYDLQYLHHAAQWILTEITRSVCGLSMDEAGKLVERIQTPVGGLVEDFGERMIVLADLSTREEILVLLQRRYPEPLTAQQLVDSIDRRTRKTVTNARRSLWRDKLIEGDPKTGYRLTRLGLREAIAVIAGSAAM